MAFSTQDTIRDNAESRHGPPIYYHAQLTLDLEGIMESSLLLGPGPSRWIARHLGIQPHTSIHHKFVHAALNLTHIPAIATADHHHGSLPNPSPSAAARAADAYP
ncbi:hypothetical protein BGW80DRAFT_1460246 [Lactifluus volemus]|nr:hypothetical protein BGW80DRAFT_1460246 [Lactifluus volemus]